MAHFCLQKWSSSLIMITLRNDYLKRIIVETHTHNMHALKLLYLSPFNSKLSTTLAVYYDGFWIGDNCIMRNLFYILCLFLSIFSFHMVHFWAGVDSFTFFFINTHYSIKPIAFVCYFRVKSFFWSHQWINDGSEVKGIHL